MIIILKHQDDFTTNSPNQTIKLSVVKLSGINNAPAYIPSMAMLFLLIDVHGVDSSYHRMAYTVSSIMRKFMLCYDYG